MASYSTHSFCLVSIIHCLLFGHLINREPPVLKWKAAVRGCPSRGLPSPPRNRTDDSALPYSPALLCTPVITKHFHGRRFILPYKSKEERVIFRHHYGWALLLCDALTTRATDLNLRRLQSSHSSWLDGRGRKRLRQDLQPCTVNRWDSQSKTQTEQAGWSGKNYNQWLEWNVKSPSQKSKIFHNK